jgi:DNA (cytosine-5)-methyltransferase 1
MNGLDLFSGIGGLSIALGEWVRTVAYCENDRYAQAVLLSRMHSGQLDLAPIWDDVRTLRGEYFGSQGVDIIFGGFPCQDISVAGHGVGLAGERSGLYWEIERLIKELSPAFVFLENVPAIRTRGLTEVVGALDELGFDCRWDILSARALGASFEGDRFFLAAANRKTLREQQGRGEGSYWKNSALDSSACDLRLTPWSSERGFESRVFGVGNGIPFAVDRDRGLGNAVVPIQAREAFKRLMGFETVQPEVNKNAPE